MLLHFQLAEGLLLVAELALRDEDGEGCSFGLNQADDLGKADVQLPHHEPLGVGAVLLALLGDHLDDLRVEREVLYHGFHLFMRLDVGGHDFVAHSHPIKEQHSRILTENGKALHPVQ